MDCPALATAEEMSDSLEEPELILEPEPLIIGLKGFKRFLEPFKDNHHYYISLIISSCLNHHCQG